ncbi:hypothetical protein MTO96_000131 [Rhipicephalus appendiculatus]
MTAGDWHASSALSASHSLKDGCSVADDCGEGRAHSLSVATDPITVVFIESPRAPQYRPDKRLSSSTASIHFPYGFLCHAVGSVCLPDISASFLF